MPDGIDPRLLTAIAEIVRQEVTPLHLGQEALREDVASIRGDITSIRGDITSIHGDITSIRADITSIHGDITSIRGDITSIRGDITSIRGDITSIRGDVASLQQGQEALRGDVAVIHSELAGIKEHQEWMATDITRFRTDTMDRIDRLQDRVTVGLSALQDDTIVTETANERAERIALAVQAETRSLAEMITPMTRQIRRLQDEVRALRGGV